MRTTARFDLLRKRNLSTLFTQKTLVETWRTVVRQQLRTMDLLDLHDYYDFNLHIEKNAKTIRNQILKGTFQPNRPLIYRLEKKMGICRHLMIPSPSDALIFQVITDHLAKFLRKASPTDRAYYSRDKHSLKLPHEFNPSENLSYPWYKLWPKFQKEIFNFSKTYPFLVVTDITNYFDSIGLRELRHIVSSRIRVDEVVLDLLFNFIEKISWNPDYLPSSLRGLPTINLEAFRLLPHVMLFELDEVLDKRTNGSFVRWMDDIDFGAESKAIAFETLGLLNDILKSRGLSLNLSKTAVYTSTEARDHFLYDVNQYLDQVQNTDRLKKDEIEAFRKEFQKHLVQNKSLRNWDKVTKRFVSLATKHKITINLQAKKLFLSYPTLRPIIFRYYLAKGYTKRQGATILDLLRNVERYDDVTLFNFVKLLTDLKVPYSSNGREFINSILKVLSQPKNDIELYCLLWFSAKYLSAKRLKTIIVKNETTWSNSFFLSRTVVSLLGRLYKTFPDWVMETFRSQITTGFRESASVAVNSLHLLSQTTLSFSVNSYVLPKQIQDPYPLPKFLILHLILSSDHLEIQEKKRILSEIKNRIKDPFYLNILPKNF